MLVIEDGHFPPHLKDSLMRMQVSLFFFLFTFFFLFLVCVFVCVILTITKMCLLLHVILSSTNKSTKQEFRIMSFLPFIACQSTSDLLC